MTQPQDRLRPGALQVGQPFNPFRFFTGIFIPEALVRFSSVSPGAKLAYGRLARYAGQGGMCFPAVDTLAPEIGVGGRQAQKYLAELEKVRLIRRRPRFSGRAQTSNVIEFLWHPLFQEGVNDRSGEGVNDDSPGGVNDSSPKESQFEESHSEETRDLDSPATNRKKRDSRPDPALATSECKEYPQLREALALYMMTGPEDEKVAETCGTLPPNECGSPPRDGYSHSLKPPSNPAGGLLQRFALVAGGNPLQAAVRGACVGSQLLRLLARGPLREACRSGWGHFPISPFDRHRGGGHPPTPATPPCVRVRTRRFETVTLTVLEQ
jgi:hypothetical protein